MKSHDAMNRCIGSDTEVIAGEMGVSAILLRKHKADPVNGSGTRNDLDRIETAIRSSLDLGRPEEDAHAPIMYLCQTFDPCKRSCSIHKATLREVERAHGKLLREIAELLEAHVDALEDGRISPEEHRYLEKEIDHVEHRLHDYRAKLQAAAVTGEAGSI